MGFVGVAGAGDVVAGAVVSGAVDSAGVAVAEGVCDGAAVAEGVPSGVDDGPAASAVGVGTLCAVSTGVGGASLGWVATGLVDPAPGSEGLSGPHDGPMFGTGGGVSNTGSTATGPVPVAGACEGTGSVAGIAGLEESSTAGVVA